LIEIEVWRFGDDEDSRHPRRVQKFCGSKVSERVRPFDHPAGPGHRPPEPPNGRTADPPTPEPRCL
jgi:hypothetical protein